MSEEELIKIIGHNIKKYRELYSKTKEIMTIEQLSKLTNLSANHIANLEKQNTNISISINALYKISIVLNVPLNNFLEKDNDK